jgi:tRNA A-37 threonylcarbamoyl transferase component Bud32
VTDEHPQFGFADEARRYRLDSRIATGGMGEVWRATDTVLGRTVAVKLLKTEYADNASFRSRFETEARHAASLHHPGVAAVYDFGEASTADGSGVHRPFLVMELVDGQPLSALLLPGQPLDPDVTRDLLAQAGDALGAAHAAGIVHRDVKPANLLVTPDRRVKITDFGIARAAEGIALTETGQVMGTPQYLSPEQAEGKTATPASDVYSLGVVAFECLAGRRPFVAETAIATALMHLREPVPELPSDVPADLAAVVRRSLAKSPAERFPDANAFAAALRDPATAATALVPPTTGAAQVLGGAAAAGLAGAGAAAAVPAPATGPVAPIGPDTGVVTGPGGDAGSGAGKDGDRGRRLLPWLLLAGVVAAAVVVFALMAGDADDPTDEPTHPSSSGRPNAPSSTAAPSSSQEPSGPASSAKPSRKPSKTASAKPSETAEPSPSVSASVSEPPSASPTTVSPSVSTSPPPSATPSSTASQTPAASSASPAAEPTAGAAADSAPGAAGAVGGPSPSSSGKVTPR